VYRVTVLQLAPLRHLVSGFVAEVPPAELTVVPMPCHFESMSAESAAVALAGNRNFLVATISKAWYLALKEVQYNTVSYMTIGARMVPVAYGCRPSRVSDISTAPRSP